MSTFEWFILGYATLTWIPIVWKTEQASDRLYDDATDKNRLVYRMWWIVCSIVTFVYTCELLYVLLQFVVKH